MHTTTFATARGVAIAAFATLHLPRDARIYQIAFQATLLTLGVVVRDFSLRPEQMLLCFAAGIATQAFWVSHLRLGRVGWLSPVIT